MKRILLLLICLSHLSYAQQWQAEVITSGLNVPWGMANIDSQRVLVTERSGFVGILNHQTGDYQRIFTFPNVTTNGQGGLLDIAHSPFERYQFYFTYSRDIGTGIETVLAKATLTENRLVNLRDLFITQSGSTSSRHYGSRITFDSTHIYFSVGDRGERSNGQNKQTHAGSIIRLTPDGYIPPDNPFVTEGEIASAIWSYGHRNPQGIFFNNSTKQLWAVEHGPRGGDEINLVLKGRNYGWPITSHGKEYWGPIAVGEAKELPGIESPKWVYTPSIAPSSFLIYQGALYPELHNKFLIAALKLTHLNVVSIDVNGKIVEQRILEELGERIRSLVVTTHGDILFGTDSGKIYRLVNSSK